MRIFSIVLIKMLLIQGFYVHRLMPFLSDVLSNLVPSYTLVFTMQILILFKDSLVANKLRDVFMFGWCGTVLSVDLTRQTFDKTALNPVQARDFLGGRDLNAKTLFDGMVLGVDPLGLENLASWAWHPLEGRQWVWART